MDRITILILALIILLILHLVEELKTGFRRKLIIGEMPRPVFITINMVIYLFSLATLILSLADNPMSPTFTWIFSI